MDKQNKRITRKLTDVAREVEQQLKTHYNVTDKDLANWRKSAKQSSHSFPKSNMVKIDELYIDYEVQRDVIHDHVRNIMKRWDPRICSPVSACQVVGKATQDTYDGQHRTVSAAILGYSEIPGCVVHTDDPNFPSYAFEMLNDTGTKRLGPGDLHRNALVRYKNGSREIRNTRARTLQDQFDSLGIDLEDKNSRKSPNLRGNNDYFFSHFKYAYKAIEVDESGKVLHEILKTIKEVFPLQEEIDQGVFIGLLELSKLERQSPAAAQPVGWMKTLLESIKPTFKSSAIVHAKAKVQWTHFKGEGATWTAPTAMSNFMRECHMHSGGKLNLPYHGEGSLMGVVDNPAPGLFPEN